MGSKRRATPTQLRNLARGRGILFEKQRRQKGIPQRVIQRIPVQVPISGPERVVPVRSSGMGLKVNFSLFDKLVETRFFPIEINNNKELLNLKQLVDYILKRLNLHWNKISSHEGKLNEIVNHITSKDKETEERFKRLEKSILDLEKENTKLKEKLAE